MKYDVKKLKEELKIDEYLELTKYDKNLYGAYVSFGQYIHILEEQIKEQEKTISDAVNHIENKIRKSFYYDYGIEMINPKDRLFTETVIELQLILQKPGKYKEI